MSTHRPHGRGVLLAAAKDVRYELEMLRQAARTVQLGELDPWLNNLVVESALLHTRNLDDFFRLERRARPDDVIARDFVSTWHPVRLVDPDLREIINKRLHHITTLRTEGPQQYPFVIWARWAGTTFDEFVRYVSGVDLEVAAVLQQPTAPR